MWSTRAVPKSSRMVCSGLREVFGNSVEVRGAGGRRGPQIEQRLDARHGGGAGGRVGNEGRGGLVQAFAEAFVVGKHKGLVFLDWAAHRGAELVALEGRGGIPESK